MARTAALTFGVIAALSPARAMVGGAPPAAGAAARAVVEILGSGGTACTATAIARDLLLTAAHCVMPGADYKLVASALGEPPVLKDVVRIEAHPQFELKRLLGHLATADVAVMKLAQPAAAKIVPVSLSAEEEPVVVGDAFEERCAQQRWSPPGNPARCKSACSIRRPRATAPALAPAPAIPGRLCSAIKMAARSSSASSAGRPARNLATAAAVSPA